MGLKLSNNAISTLASGITAASTSIALATGTGSKFPTLAAGDYFPATISNPDGTFEIVRVTARSGDTLTVTRAQEGTTALAFDAGTLIELRLTAGTIDAINTSAGNALSQSGGTMTGDLTMGAGTKIVLEGTADDANEITIVPGNPTADRTLNLPDKSGTLATTDDVPQAFPSGTKMLFQQTAAPTGWTKDTTHDNKALRVVSGTAGSGGATAFTSVFQNQTPTISLSDWSVGATTLSTSQLPGHTHGLNPNILRGRAGYSGLNNGVAVGGAYAKVGALDDTGTSLSTDSNGSGSSHTHSISGSATSSGITLNVQYVDIIIASKD